MKKGMNAIRKEKSRKGEARAGGRGPRKMRGLFLASMNTLTRAPRFC